MDLRAARKSMISALTVSYSNNKRLILLSDENESLQSDKLEIKFQISNRFFSFNLLSIMGDNFMNSCHFIPCLMFFAPQYFRLSAIC